MPSKFMAARILEDVKSLDSVRLSSRPKPDPLFTAPRKGSGVERVFN
jgi:hypothetical protein